MKFLAQVQKKLNPILPSWTIINFGLSSCGCIVVDKVVFTGVCMPLQNTVGRAVAILVAVIVARIISGNCNYFYNQRCVFRRPATWKSYFQYWGLVAFNVSLSLVATEIITLWMDTRGFMVTVVNFSVDVSLFFFSYAVQKLFIFKKGV